MKVAHSALSRKALLHAGALSVLLFGLAICNVSLPSSSAQSTGGFESAIYDVVPRFTTLTSQSAPGATFFIMGEIYPFRTVNPATCDPLPAAGTGLGTWRAWGEVADGGRLVMQQSMQLTQLNGLIEVQGPSGVMVANEGRTPAIVGATGAPFVGPAELLSAVGGAGTFRGANGEVHITPYCQSDADTQRPFRYDHAFCFDLRETSRRKGANR